MFRDLPIKRKLTLLAMLTSASALLLAGAALVIYEMVTFRSEMTGDLATFAEMTGFNCASALSFKDADSARQTLEGLRTQPQVVAACVYDLDGTVLAEYQRGKPPVAFGPPPVNGIAAEFNGDHVDMFRPITFDDEPVGTIYLRSDLTELNGRLERYAIIVVAVGLLSVLLAHAIGGRLRRIIADPISSLSMAAERVVAEKDYTVRAERLGNDELGRLTDAFNEMLGQIQANDDKLRETQGQLEKRVVERTKELAYERDQLRALLDSSPDSIYFKDEESRFVQLSRSKVDKMMTRVPGLRERLLGPGSAPATPVDPERLVGLSDADTYTDEHNARALADEREIVRTGQPLIGKVEKQTFLDGTVCWSLTSKMPWRDREGKIIGTFGLSKDITELKLAEQQLEQVHRQLLETSRAAGMAEVATGVLHNVGNVLNSVNVSATIVSDQLRHSKAANISRVYDLLRQHSADLAQFISSDPKGQMVLPYLGSLVEAIATERTTMAAELEGLKKNIEHIKDIVAMQQSYAKTSGVAETVSIPDLVEDALRMNAGSLARHDVDVVRDYQARPVITVEKHKVLQVLVNLIRNAKYACDESGRTDKRMTIRSSADENGVAIAVVDNGIGIRQENLTRIFSHGFTTRKEGHGFGLHSGALAAKEMGGTLTGHSAGPGQGATFILELPYKSEAMTYEKPPS